jgi:hypothetical protein
LLLFLVEQATGTDRPPSAIPRESLLAPLIIPRTPAGDSFLTNSQDGGDIDDRVTQLPRMDRPQPKGVEDVIGLGTSVG